jgi:pimeloyl-ACP methyl ester carboxylesterase
MSRSTLPVHMTLTALTLWAMPIVLSAVQAQDPLSAASTRMVGVDGVEIRVRTMGPGTRRPGQPAVVFEGGASAPLETWDTILADVARFAPVVAYDRAGTGQSTWDGLPPTPERVGTRLRRLLSQIQVAPPYILVGHSWGGALVRYVSGQRPGEIAGVLYIDPTDITLTRADLVALFESFGAGAAEYDAFDQVMKRSIAGLPPPLLSEATVDLRPAGDRHRAPWTDCAARRADVGDPRGPGWRSSSRRPALRYQGVCQGDAREPGTPPQVMGEGRRDVRGGDELRT